MSERCKPAVNSKRQPHTLENLAEMLHRLQCAAIRKAFGLRDGEKAPNRFICCVACPLHW